MECFPTLASMKARIPVWPLALLLPLATCDTTMREAQRMVKQAEVVNTLGQPMSLSLFVKRFRLRQLHRGVTYEIPQ